MYNITLHHTLLYNSVQYYTMVYDTMSLRQPRRFRVSGCATTFPLPRSGAIGNAVGNLVRAGSSN